MYGLPENVDLSFLPGATLLQVCVGENEVILELDPQVSIMVASNVRLTDPDGAASTYEDARAAGTALLPLLGDSVAAAAGSRDGTLTIEWSRGPRLEIFDTWKEYESYTIRHGESTLVV